MCDLFEDDPNNSEYPDVTCSPEGTGISRRGDLLLCNNHAKLFSPNVGRVPGEVRCSCGYFRPIGSPCGEPCM